MAGAKWWEYTFAKKQRGCAKSKVIVVSKMDSGSLTQANLQWWLLDRGVPRSDIDRRSANFLLDLYKPKKYS